jgi:hypothetical protein
MQGLYSNHVAVTAAKTLVKGALWLGLYSVPMMLMAGLHDLELKLIDNKAQGIETAIHNAELHIQNTIAREHNRTRTALDRAARTFRPAGS